MAGEIEYYGARNPDIGVVMIARRKTGTVVVVIEGEVGWGLQSERETTRIAWGKEVEVRSHAARYVLPVREHATSWYQECGGAFSGW